jgi:hypothetical protein
MRRTRTRIAISLTASVAVVATIAGSAGARVPILDAGDGIAQSQPAAVAAPDAIDRALQRRTRTLGTTAVGTDAIARAIARRSR